jgi:hypothetical protein
VGKLHVYDEARYNNQPATRETPDLGENKRENEVSDDKGQINKKNERLLTAPYKSVGY